MIVPRSTFRESHYVKNELLCAAALELPRTHLGFKVFFHFTRLDLQESAVLHTFVEGQVAGTLQ